MTALAKKVLLIGWDAADWKIANPLIDQGLMPTLDDFINHGVMEISPRCGRFFRPCCGIRSLPGSGRTSTESSASWSPIRKRRRPTRD